MTAIDQESKYCHAARRLCRTFVEEFLPVCVDGLLPGRVYPYTGVNSFPGLSRVIPVYVHRVLPLCV